MILFKKVPDFAFNDHEIVGIRCCCQIVLLVVVLLNLAASIFFNGNWFRNRSKQSLNFILWTLLKYFHILDDSRTLNAYVSYNTTRIHNIWQKRLQSHFIHHCSGVSRETLLFSIRKNMNDPILGSFHVWGCINDALLIWSINLQSVDFSMFLWFFSAIVFATTKKTQQKIARVINYHSSLTKIPVLYFNRVKIAFFWTT